MDNTCVQFCLPGLSIGRLLCEAAVELRWLPFFLSNKPTCEPFPHGIPWARGPLGLSTAPGPMSHFHLFSDHSSWGGGTEVALGLWDERILISKVVFSLVSSLDSAVLT